MNPINGAVDFTRPVIYSAMVAHEVGGATRQRVLASLEVRGPKTTKAYLAHEVGRQSRGVALSVLDAGSKMLARSRQAVDVAGNRRYAVVNGLTVKGLAADKAWASPINIEIVKTSKYAVRHALTIQNLVRWAVRHAADIRKDSDYISYLAHSVAKQRIVPALMTHEVSQLTEAMVAHSLDVRFGESFVVMADIVPAELDSATQFGPTGFYPEQDLNAHLRVNNVAVPIRAFDYQEPDGKLGAMLNLTLAIPDKAQVPMGATIDFDLVLTQPDDEVIPFPLVKGGKIGGRDYTIQWGRNGPGDELTVAIADVLNNVFSLAPRRPIIMFDPDSSSLTDIQVRPKDAVLDEDFRPIMPIIEPVRDLTMLHALQRAFTGRSGYDMMTRLEPPIRTALQPISALIGGAGDSYTTKGMGFTSVVTNIKNYPIRRADFSLDSWFDGVQPFVSMFGPLYSVTGNVLMVFDTELALPAGTSSRIVPISGYVRMSQSTPYRDPYNAALVTYQGRELDSDAEVAEIRTRYVEEKSSVGQYGSAGFTETLTRTRLQEKLSETGVVLSSAQEEIVTEVRVAGSDGIPVLAHRETQQDFYADDLKTGHHKRVESLILVGSTRSTQLRDVMTEDCSIVWVDDPMNAGQKIQYRNTTRIESLVYIAEDEEERLNPVTGQVEEVKVKYPALAAQASPGTITDDGTLEWMPTRVITETLRAVNSTTLDVNVIDVDLLIPATRRSVAQPRTGGRSVNQYANRSKTILFRDKTGTPVSEDMIGPRTPVSINAGELPEEMWKSLGKRVLKRAVNPPDDYTLALPGVDFASYRGSVVKGQERDGSLTPSIAVRGRGITGVNLGQTGHRISMTLKGVVLPTT